MARRSKSRCGRPSRLRHTLPPAPVSRKVLRDAGPVHRSPPTPAQNPGSPLRLASPSPRVRSARRVSPCGRFWAALAGGAPICGARCARVPERRSQGPLRRKRRSAPKRRPARPGLSGYCAAPSSDVFVHRRKRVEVFQRQILQHGHDAKHCAFVRLGVNPRAVRVTVLPRARRLAYSRKRTKFVNLRVVHCGTSIQSAAPSIRCGYCLLFALCLALPSRAAD